MLIKPSRRSLLTGAAAMAAMATIGHNGGPALDDEAQAGMPRSGRKFRAALTPYQIMGSGQIAAWWSSRDYNLRMTDAGSFAISSWRDRITALAMTDAASAPARPTWVANNDYPYLTFDGVANCLVSTSFAALPTGATAGSVFVIASGVTTTASVTNAFAYGGATGGAIIRQIAKQNSDQCRVSDGTTNIASPSTILSSLQILYGDWSGTTEDAYQNGIVFASSPATIATLATGTTRARIGAGVASTAAGFWPGNIHDVFVTNVVPSTLQRQQLEGFFAWTRQAPVGGVATRLLPSHPYYGARP